MPRMPNLLECPLRLNQKLTFLLRVRAITSSVLSARYTLLTIFGLNMPKVTGISSVKNTPDSKWCKARQKRTRMMLQFRAICQHH